MTQSALSRGVGPALAGLTLAAFTVRLAWFTTTPHPLGTDGYYYVVQTADLVSRGRLHVPDSSWVFLLHGGIGLLFEPVLTTKIVGALLAAVVVPCAWFAGSARSPQTGAALALWAAASPTLTHLAADFPKNLGVAAPWFVLCALADRGGRWRWPGVLLACLALATAHRTGMVWAGVALGCWALLGVGRKGPGENRLVGLGLLALMLLFFVVAPFVPGLLSLGDRFRLEGQLTVGGLSPFAWFALRPFSVAEKIELCLAWPALVAALWTLGSREHRPSTVMSLGFLVVTVLPVFAVDRLDLGYRLALLAPLVALPLMLHALPVMRVPWGVLALGCLALPLATRGVDPEDLPPYDRFDRLVEGVPRPLPELLIAHQGINFLYDHRTGEEAMAWAPEPTLDRATVGRIVWGVRESEWVALGPPGRVRLDADYSYVTEAGWESFRTRALAEDDPDLTARVTDWRNPSRVRPAALTRGRDPSREHR